MTSVLDVPVLGRKDLEEQLARLCSKSRNHHLFAFFGSGAAETLELPRVGRLEIVPVRSELELRARMPPLQTADARIAFLVPFTSDVPLDIAGRFALRGRVQRIGPEARLRGLFGATEIEPDVRPSALGSYLLQPGPERAYPAPPGGRLTMAAAWSTWLAADWKVEVEGGLALDTLLGWAALDQRGPAFVEAMAAPAAAGVRPALFAHLAGQAGIAAVAVWMAWERGQGGAALEMALLAEPLVDSPDAGVRMWLRQTTRAALVLEAPDAPPDADKVANALGRAAGGALRYLAGKSSAADLRALVNAADTRASDPEIRAALAPSTRLPTGWTQRLEALGQALLAGAVSPSGTAVQRASEALRRLEGHDFFKHQDQLHLAGRAEMAVRLLAWLAEQPEARLESGMQLHADVAILGRWYSEEGGHVDLARRRARGPREDGFGAGVQAVVQAADDVRSRLDRRFARALGHWVQAGCPADLVTPIDRAIREIATRFLDEDADHRVLVLLFDGMAWAQAVELLQALGEGPAPWGPLAWRARATGGAGHYPVVLAGLPTVTEVSRAAVFAGKPSAAGMATGTDKDVDRWQQNRDVARFSRAPDVPRLLLRAEGHTPGGEATSEALSLIGDKSRRIVALVINAIDASLKGDSQLNQRWDLGSIRALADLLARAREAGRAVLMCTDHGHVRSDRLVSAGTFDGAGARWRPLAVADAAVADFEVALPAGPHVWAPKGAAGVALIADDAHRYGGGAHAGEHGGASLAEVVAPFVLIGCDDRPVERQDPALDVRPAHVPGWWHFEVTAPVGAALAPGTGHHPLQRKTRRTPATVATGSEPPVVPAPVTASAATAGTDPSPPAPTRPESPLATSDVLKARAPDVRVRKQVLAAVEFLLERKGVASQAAFAAALGVLEFRVGGQVSVLQEVLNADGYQVLRYDHAGRQVHLDRVKLEQQFGVKL